MIASFSDGGCNVVEPDFGGVSIGRVYDELVGSLEHLFTYFR